MHMLQWHISNQFGNAALDMLGFIPAFINSDDPRSIIEQINENYAHGGGWFKFEGFEVLVPKSGEPLDYRLYYPGDSAFHAVAWARHRDEQIIVFQHAWVLVIKADGTHEVSRID